MNAIEINELKKNYPVKGQEDVQALKGVSFSIPKGQLFGLLGPNGAGKSTLIHILGGVTRKSSGMAKVMGIDIDKDHRAAKMKLGIVPQEISFDSFLTVDQALQLQFGYYQMKVDLKKIDDILEQLALTDKRSQNPRALSGGMKRRFMIARALIHSPELLILDEPTAGVDVELRHSMYDLIRELNEAGTTIILTTHYLEEVELLCERVGIIHHGNLVALDDKQQLKDRFQSTRKLILALTEQKELPASLQQFSPKMKGTQVCLTFEESQYQSILKLVAEANLPIASFSVIEPTIEDVFINLTDQKPH